MYHTKEGMRDREDTIKMCLANQIGTMLNTNGDSGSLDQNKRTRKESECVKETATTFCIEQSGTSD